MNDSIYALLFVFDNNVHEHYTLQYCVIDNVYAVLCAFQPRCAVFEFHVVNHHQITFVVLDM